MNNLSRTLVLCSALMLTACAEDDPQQFIEEGKALFEKGDMKSAKVQFKNAIQINPKLAKAYYGLALIEEKEKAWPAMKKNLQDTLAIDPNHLDAHVKLGLIERLAGQVDKAKEQVALAFKLNPSDVNAMLLEASIQNDEDHKDKSLQLVEEILEKDPLNVGAISLKASILLSYKRYDEALIVLDHGVEVYPKELGLDMLKIQLHKELGDDEAVIQDFEILIPKHPDNKTLYYSQLKALLDMGKSKKVEEALRKAINVFPSDIDMKLMLITHIEHRNLAEAEKLLKEFIVAQPESYQLKSRLAEFYIANQRILDAEPVLKGIVVADPIGKDGLNAKIRLADLAWIQKDKETVNELVEQVLAVDSGNGKALLLRAQLRLDNKQADAAISDLRIVLRDQPDSDRAMIAMANAYLFKREFEVAESHWRKALEVNPKNPDAIIPLVTVLLNRGEIGRAVDLLNKSIKTSPNDPVLLELLVKLHVSQKDWGSAEATISTLKKMPQNAIATQMLEGMLAKSRGRYEQAIKIYKDILSNQPGVIIALKELGQIYKRTGRGNDWVEYLKGYIEQNQDKVLAYNMLGRTYAMEKKWNEAREILQQALQVKSKSPETYGVFAAVQVQQGKNREAVGTYRKGLITFPDNPVLLMKLAKQYERMQDFGKAIVIYDNLLKQYPDNVQVANNLAYLLVESSGDEAGRKRALSLVIGFKDSQSSYLLDTYGWVLFKSGDVEEAIVVLKNVVKLAPEVALFRYHLGEAYYAVKNLSASKVELEKVLFLSKKKAGFSEGGRVRELLKEIAEVAHS